MVRTAHLSRMGSVSSRFYPPGMSCVGDTKASIAALSSRWLRRLLLRPDDNRGETDFAFRNLPKRFDHEFLLSCPYSGLQIVEGIAPKHRHPALTHDGAGVVVASTR